MPQFPISQINAERLEAYAHKNGLSLDDALSTMLDNTQKMDITTLDQEFLVMLFSSLPVLLYIYNLDENRIVFTNESLTDFLGYPPGADTEWDRNFLEGLIHPDDIEDVRDQFKQMADDPQPQQYKTECRMLHADGTYRWILNLFQPFRLDDDGNLQQLLGSLIEVTAQHKIEEELRETQKQHEEAQRIAGIGHWDYDVDTGRNQWSSGMYHAYRMRPEDGPLTWTKLKSLMDEDDQTMILDAIERTIKTRQPYEIRWKLHAPDGTTQYIESRGRPLTDPTGRVYRIMGTDLNITRQYTAERELEMLNSDLVAEVASRVREANQIRDDLSDSEERYRTIVETAQEGVWMVDADANTTYVNKRMAEILGYMPNEMEGQPLWNYIDDDDLKQAKEYFLHRQADIAEQYDYRFKHRDGHDVWTSISSTPLKDKNGQFIGAVGLINDITKRKEAEDSLLQVSRLQQAILDTTTASIITTDIYGIIKSFNPGAEYLLGYSVEEVIDKQSILKLHSPDEISSCAVQLSRMTHKIIKADFQTLALAAQYPEHQINEWTYINRTGDPIPVELALSPLRGENNEITGFLSIAFDITDRKLAEQALRDNEVRFRKLAENSPDIIYTLDVEDQFIEYLNRNDFLGYDLSQFKTGPEMMSMVYDDDIQLVANAWAQIMVNGAEDTVLIEYRVVSPDNTIAWIQNRITPYLFHVNGEASHILCTMTDITQRKQNEIALLNSLEKERELSALKSRFVMMASHEFRTPLTTILSSSQLIERYLDKMEPERRGMHLKKIEMQVHHMTDLLDDILMIGRLEANVVPLIPEPVEVCEFITEIVEEFQQSNPSQHIEFIHTNLSTLAYVDRKLFRKIITNLTSNAIKYSPNATPIKILLEQIDDTIIISVEDHGIGIPEPDQQRLFDAFHRATNVGTIGGTGLGLSITYHAVDLHGGSIEVESEVNKGTTFTVTLPQQPDVNNRRADAWQLFSLSRTTSTS